MDSGRRQRSDGYNQEGTRARFQSRKPPLGNWRQTVPSWERRFCWEVGSVPWKKLVETKKIIHLYDNVLEWDDSAGEEAFYNAKHRYWALLNGLPCDIPLPDLDALIDNVDWNSEIDPELILDLNRDSVVPEKGEQVVILGEPFAKSHGLSSPGWGDEGEDYRKVTNLPSGDGVCDHGGQWDSDPVWDRAVESKVNEVAPSGWGNGWNGEPWVNSWESRVNEFGNDDGGAWENGCSNSCSGGVWKERYNSNFRENGGRTMSRYKTTRFQGDDRVNQWERRNRSGRRRENLVQDRRYTDRSLESPMNTCRPINHQRGSAKQGSHWICDKPVL